MLTIREIREKDLDRLLEIINQPSVVRYMPLEKPVKREKIEKWYQSFIVFRWPVIFVLETDRVIGACTLSEDGKVTIWIDQSEQRKGYGIKAIDWLKDFAKNKGIDRLWLECFKDNAIAIDFYHKVGFRDTAEKQENIIMEMPI
jgi:RimJ/RimL family protein N-acetyltransferase